MLATTPSPIRSPRLALNARDRQILALTRERLGVTRSFDEVLRALNEAVAECGDLPEAEEDVPRACSQGPC
jgi:hypothetical protein